MAKFCTKCGKKLEEGKVCDCEKTTSEKVMTVYVDEDGYTLATIKA